MIEIKIPIVFVSKDIDLLYNTYLEKCVKLGIISEFTKIGFSLTLNEGKNIWLQDYIFQLKKGD